MRSTAVIEWRAVQAGPIATGVLAAAGSEMRRARLDAAAVAVDATMHLHNTRTRKLQ